MNDRQTTRISKYLSYVLRHNPDDAGISLRDGGWVDIESLVRGIQEKFPEFDEALLLFLVETDAKGRYAMEDGQVRAQQGHSIEVGSVASDTLPPDALFHGTTARNWESIQTAGAIKPMRRNHVHLSSDVETASTLFALLEKYRPEELADMEAHSATMR